MVHHKVLLRNTNRPITSNRFGHVLRDHGYEVVQFGSNDYEELAIAAAQEDVDTVILPLTADEDLKELLDLETYMDEYHMDRYDTQAHTVVTNAREDTVSVYNDVVDYAFDHLSQPEEVVSFLDDEYDWRTKRVGDYGRVDEEAAELLEENNLIPGHTSFNEVQSALEPHYGRDAGLEALRIMEHNRKYIPSFFSRPLVPQD